MFIEQAKRVFELESKAIADLSNQLTQDFEGAIESILKSSGRLVVCGMGKSGLIGRKMVATFASTGTPSFFMHPGEAYHGDLGMVAPDDVFLAISNSGETDELIRLIPFLKDNGNTLISMAGNSESTLATNADFHLDISVEQEACPLQLAPTSSTTATLAMGDALAVVLMQARDFQPENFARFHPGGSLGRRLLTKVKHVMKTDELPKVQFDSPMPKVIQAISAGRLGLVMVEQDGAVVGVITDGDLRREMQSSLDGFMQLNAANIMSETPKMIDAMSPLVEAEAMMNEHKITSLLVKEDTQVTGIVQIYDL